MKKVLLLISILFVISQAHLNAQDQVGDMWQGIDIQKEQLSRNELKIVEEVDADYFRIDSDKIRSILDKVPTEYHNSVEISLPIKQDNPVMVELDAYNTMHPKLAKKHPSIRTYKGFYKNYSIFLTLSPLGISAYVYSPQEGMLLIQPVSPESHTLYRRYRLNDFKDLKSIVDCGINSHTTSPSIKVTSRADYRGTNAVNRKYRLAMVATESYSEYFNHNHEQTLASIVDLVNGLNSIYINVMGIRFEMIPESDTLIFTDINEDPFGDRNTEGPYMLNSNTAALFNLIGNDAYDVGHVITKCSLGEFGGVSRSRIVCNDGKKGAGVTCVNQSGSTLYTTAHEFGHHFSAGHTFNNCPPQAGQLSSSSGVEPGSGFTIMSYAGACGSQNLGFPRQNYFSVFTLDQVITYSRVGLGSTCGEEYTVDNQSPVVNILDSTELYIPISTFFELRGEGSDADGDLISYNWEEVDVGPASPVGSPIGSAPAFISQFPQSEPYRHFPQKNYALAHAFYKLEVLPTYTRDLTFRLTARDGKPGMATWEEMVLHAIDTIGPFKVTQPGANPPNLVAGQKLLVEWDVAKTDLPPVNCQRVDIYFSPTGGYNTFYLVADNTENDGSAEVLLPGIITEDARIKVKASDNVFFDYSLEDFTIVNPSEPTYALTYTPYFQKMCLPATHTVEIKTSKLLDYNGIIHFRMLDTIPTGMIASFEKDSVIAGNSTSLIFDMTDFRNSGTYFFDIEATSESDTTIFTVSFKITSSYYEDFALLSPTDGESEIAQTSAFDWSGDMDAVEYQFQLSEDPLFNNPILDRTIKNTEFQYSQPLKKGTIYYWRVRPRNTCGAGEWSDVWVYKTIQQDCEIVNSGIDDVFIPGQGVRTVKAPIDIDLTGSLIDVNIPYIDGEHQYVGQLTVSLESPVGTKVLLWDRECVNGTGFNLGLDDASVIPVSCPLTTDKIFKPAGKLGDFNGEEANGEWNLIIKDNVSGAYGILHSWELQLCFESSYSSPNAYLLDTLRVEFNSERSLGKAIGLSHPDYKPWQITLHPISLPQYGTLFRIDGNGNETELGLDSTFTMQELYYDKIVVRHNGGTEIYDEMRFYATTPDGGWTGSLTLPIKYQTMVSTITIDNVSHNNIVQWPSPAHNKIYFRLDGQSINGEWQLMDINGHLLQSIKVNNSAHTHDMNVGSYSAGLYILRWQSEKAVLSKKIIIQ